VFASAFAAIAALQVIFFGEDLIPLFVVVKVFVLFDLIIIH
jgi:hypothetical protein